MILGYSLFRKINKFTLYSLNSMFCFWKCAEHWPSEPEERQQALNNDKSVKNQKLSIFKLKKHKYSAPVFEAQKSMVNCNLEVQIIAYEHAVGVLKKQYREMLRVRLQEHMI